MQIVLGMGCDRNTPLQTLSDAVDEALAKVSLPRSAVTALATIDKKNDEVALLQLAADNNWPLHFYPAAELAVVEVPCPSETVRKYMGTPAVSEAAALLAAHTQMHDLLLEKYKFKGSCGKNATVSIAHLKTPSNTHD